MFANASPRAVLAVGAVSMLLLAGCSGARVAHPSAHASSTTAVAHPAPTERHGLVVEVRLGSTITLTAPINGSNLDYAGVAQDFAAPGVISSLREYDGGTIRYPGGTLANYWEWQSGSVDQPPTISNAGTPKPGRVRDYGFTLRTLQGIVRETGVTPVFDLNLLTSTLSDQLSMLHTAQGLGIPVRYVELGNEFYLRNSSYLKAFPTAASYARTVAQWAPAIRAAFPDAEIAAVGSLPQRTAREKAWNTTLLSIAGADINAVTLHDYPTIGKDPSPARVLASAQASWRSTERVMASIPDRYRIWFTEFNMARHARAEGEPPRGATWVHGLYVAELTALFDGSPRVQLDDYWDLFSKPSRGVFTSGPRPKPTVAGTALLFLTHASARADRVTPLRFRGAPVLPGGAAGLIGLSFSGPNGTRTVLLNLTDHAVTMSTGATTGATATTGAAPGAGTGLSPGVPTVSVHGALTATVSDLARTTGVLGTTLTLPADSITGVGFVLPPSATA